MLCGLYSSAQRIQFDEIPEIQGNIYAIHQATSGQLWVGTNTGLYRFDGLHAELNSTSEGAFRLTNNYVVSIFEDSKGRLWCGTRDGLNILDLSNKSVRVFHEKKGDTIPGIGHPEVRQIVELLQNRYVIGTYGGGVTLFDEADSTFQHFVHEVDVPGSLPANNVNDVFQDSKGRIWVGTELGGLSQFDPHKGTFRQIKLDQEYTVSSITEDNEGRLWVGTWHRGLFLLDEQRQRLVSKLVHADFYDNRNAVRRIAQFDDSTLWVGTMGGLIAYQLKTGDTTGYYSKEHLQGTLKGNVIWSFEQTNDEVWWVGTVHEGLHKYDRYAHKFFPWAIDQTVPYSPQSTITGIEKMPDGQLWLFTKAKEVCIFDPVSTKFIDNRSLKPLRGFRMKSLEVDAFNQVWMVTTGGLVRWNRQSDQVEVFENLFFQHGEVEVGGVYDLDIGPMGDLYVVGWGFGLVKIPRFALQKERLTRSDIEFVNPDGKEEIDPVIWAVNVGADGIVWLGGKSKSQAYDPKSNSLRLLPEKWSDVQLATYQDQLWAIESDGHIARIEKNATWNYVRKLDLGTEKVLKVAIDDNKYVWISTSVGHVWRVALDKQDEPVRFDQSDGFADAKGWSDFVQWKDGTYLFLSGERVLQATERSMRRNNTIPKIGLHEVKLFDRLLLHDVSASEEDHKVTEGNGTYFIRLENHENRLEFEFEVLSYSSVKDVVFQYRLDTEEQWNTTTADFPWAKYPQLPHGEHRFFARAISADGVPSPDTLLATITIEAPWWMKWWAFLVYGALLVGLVWFAFSFSLVSIKAKNKLAFESYRIAKQEELNDVKMQFFTNLSHELKTPLTLILGPINKLLNESGDVEQQKALANVKRNAEHLNTLVSELLEFKRIESGMSKLIKEVVDVRELVNEAMLNYSELAALKQIDVVVDLPEDTVKLELDLQKFTKVVHNLLSNAFKYTPENGSIIVSGKKSTHGFFDLSVEDSGKGIDPGLLETLFERFVTDEKRSGQAGSGTGIGLALVKQIVLAHGGEVSAENTSLGARFVVSLPVYDQVNQLPEVVDHDLNHAFQQYTKGLSILVVEDNVEIRQFVKSILETDYIVFTASNGLEALELAKAETPHLILSDVMMPEMDGFELCRKVKTDILLSHIPVILLTARTRKEDLVQGLESRADDYIPKPFDSKVLMLKIRNILDSRRLWIQNFKVQQKVEVDASSLTSIDEKFLNDVLATIEAKIEDTSFNVEQLSKEIGMHRSHLTRKLTALTEFSPVAFIRHIRLTKAMELLKTAKLTVSDVAYQVGYDNPRYFSTSFKKQFGKTPTEVLEAQTRG